MEAHPHESLWVGLRLAEGVELTTLQERQFGAAIERFVRQGLMRRDGSVVRLTDRGVLLSNEVFAEF